MNWFEYKSSKQIAMAFAAIALIYAFFAGWRTIGDPDLGWQLATGRWIVEHRAIPHTDVLSYTSGGAEWIYPALSQVILYCTYLLGGYTLLSLLTAAACVGTTAVQMRGNIASKCLAAIAVPIIAIRTAPRAELFTTVLFAIFVSLLWKYHCTGQGRLWLLPLSMFLWVNLHGGYLSGTGMCVAYVFLEFCEMLAADRRAEALTRLRKAYPWLLATLAATLLNPWVIRNYFGMAKLVPVHSNGWIMELAGMRASPRVILEGLGFRDPRSSFWWLVGAAAVAIVAALFQKRYAAAIILAVASIFPIRTVRFQGPFATIVVVIAGSVLASSASTAFGQRVWKRLQKSFHALQPVHAMLACLLMLTTFAGLRIWDLATNRVYLRLPYQLSLFGPGVSPWYPERAAAFVKQEGLPANVFNDYTSGGFVTWRLGPNYPAYIDGRGVSGNAIFFRAFDLLAASLDSPKWRQEADDRNVNTIFTSVNPEFGGGLANLKQYCESKEWRLVFLDTKASVFLRAMPQTDTQVGRLQQDCKTIRFDTPPVGDGTRARAERFLYFKNAALILLTLDRPSEALEKATLASNIFSDNADVHLAKGLALFHLNRAEEAEKELKTSLDLEPADANSQALASLYRQNGRYKEAAEILGRQLDRSDRPYQMGLLLGFLQIDLNTPTDALLTFDKAEKQSPYNDEAASLGIEFRTQLAQGRANAWFKIAEGYESRGLRSEATQARQQSESFQNIADTAEIVGK